MSQSAGSSAPIESDRALLFHRDRLRWIELPERHRVTYHPGGWRIEFAGPTKVKLHLEGEEVKLDLEGKDYMLCSGNDVYVSLAARSDSDRGRSSTKKDKEG